jgi:hypothetical protein
LIKPAINVRSVVFPLPLGPRKRVSSPAKASNDALLIAVVA